MKKLAFILILLMLISMPVSADRETVADYVVVIFKEAL